MWAQKKRLRTENTNDNVSLCNESSLIVLPNPRNNWNEWKMKELKLSLLAIFLDMTSSRLHFLLSLPLILDIPIFPERFPNKNQLQESWKLKFQKNE